MIGISVPFDVVVVLSPWIVLGALWMFDRKARERLVRDDPSAARKIGRLGKTYAVLGRDGAVVTVGHRFRRIPGI